MATRSVHAPVLAVPLAVAIGLGATACAKSDDAAPPPAKTVAEPPATAAPTAPAEPAADACGPQSPRDISKPAGANTVPVRDGDAPNLCNVHFHDPFEHAGFDSVATPNGTPGQLVCKTVDVGQSLEFHWVYSSCPPNAKPVKGLANCVCDDDNMVLRVFAQAYVVGEQGVAPTQPTTNMVSYKGSTTGKSYDDKTCSPARVNWQVARTVPVIARAELAAWCETNPWIDEDHPHSSRPIVTAPKWLSAIAPM